MYSIKDAFNIDGKEVKIISLNNKKNMEVRLLNYGATLVELLVPDKNSIVENIVLTYENLNDYIKNEPYFGATIGRTSGRIAEGRFRLDGKEYQLNKNFGLNQCHGGARGFSFQVWDYELYENKEETRAKFSYISRDREENYPGNLNVKVSYILTDRNELIIEYNGNTHRKTLCNLTNHSYFNLSGNYKRKVTEQYLKIKANSFLELDNNQVPTGNKIDVRGTPMDFRESKLIGKDIENKYDQLVMANGYDHPWLLRNEKNQIEMHDKLSGRKMTITTTYPSVVVYSYNFPKNEELKYKKIASKYDGICFETQYEPNGINMDTLNSAILNPGTNYYERTKFKFETF